MTECRAKDPLSCRFHGQEKLVDRIFELNQRTLGWQRTEFTAAGEETLRQMVFYIATLDDPRADLDALISTVKKRADLNNLRPYFDVESAVAEIAYRYDPHKHEIPPRNLLDAAEQTTVDLDRMYARYLVENGSLDYRTPASRYIGRQHGMHTCAGIVAIHAVRLYRNSENDYTAGAVVIEGDATCACGRIKNNTYSTESDTDRLLRYALSHPTA